MLSAAPTVLVTVLSLGVGTLTGVAATCDCASDLLGWGDEEIFEVRFNDRVERIEADLVRIEQNMFVFESDDQVVAVVPQNYVKYVARTDVELEPGIEVVVDQGTRHLLPGSQIQPESHNMLRILDRDGATVGFVVSHRVQSAMRVDHAGDSSAGGAPPR